MRRISLLFPWLLMLLGICMAFRTGFDNEWLWCAIWCVVAAIGYGELEASSLFNWINAQFRSRLEALKKLNGE